MPDQVELDCGGSWVVHDLPLSEPVQAQVDRGQVRQRPVAAQGLVMLGDGEPELVVTEPEPAPEYDPSEHTVDGVLAYLANATDIERARVLAAEEAGKARTTILSA